MAMHRHRTAHPRSSSTQGSHDLASCPRHPRHSPHPLVCSAFDDVWRVTSVDLAATAGVCVCQSPVLSLLQLQLAILVKKVAAEGSRGLICPCRLWRAARAAGPRAADASTETSGSTSWDGAFIWWEASPTRYFYLQHPLCLSLILPTEMLTNAHTQTAFVQPTAPSSSDIL